MNKQAANEEDKYSTKPDSSTSLTTAKRYKVALSVPSLRNPRRRAELGMLILQTIIFGLIYVLSQTGLTGKIPVHIPRSTIWLAVLPYLCHLGLQLLAPDADPAPLPLISFLNGFGYVMILRLDPQEAALQALWSAVGVVGFLLTLVIVQRVTLLDRYRYLMMLFAIMLVLLPLAPVIGENINGARLWVRFGPLSFQPIEIAKLMLAIFFASYMVEKREVLAQFSPFKFKRASVAIRAAGPILLAWSISLLVMTAERDVGFSLLIFLIFVIAIWVATSNWWYLVFGSGLFVVGAFVAARLFGQVNERITVWLDPWKYSQTIGYQIVQALYAFGSGGFSGVGLGRGHPGLIPVVTSDFIFAAIGEETGLLGTTAILFCFALLVGFGLRVSKRAPDQFSAMTATVLTLTFGLQAFFIMAGVTKLLPLTGVTLPFVAYGGSSLVANYVLFALLLRISSESKRQNRYTKKVETRTHPTA